MDEVVAVGEKSARQIRVHAAEDESGAVDEGEGAGAASGLGPAPCADTAMGHALDGTAIDELLKGAADGRAGDSELLLNLTLAGQERARLDPPVLQTGGELSGDVAV